MEDMESASSIADQVKHCFAAFRRASSELDQADEQIARKIRSSDLTDELGRFRLWCGNIGAHRDGRSSLAHKLRDASHIREQVIELLQNLQVTIEEGALSISSIEFSRLIHGSDPDHRRRENPVGRFV